MNIFAKSTDRPRLLTSRFNFQAVSHFVMVATFLGSIAAHAAVTVEFLAPPTQWTTAEKEAVFYLKANGGAIGGVHCWIGALNPDRGDPASRDSFECTAPDSLAANAVSQLTVRLSPGAVLKPGTYTAVLQVLGIDPSSNAVSQAATFKVIVPAVTIKVGETDAIRIRMIRRPWPFSDAKAAIPIDIRVTSDLAPTRLPAAVATQLYVQDADAKDIVPAGYLKAYFCESKPETEPTSDKNVGKTDPASSSCSQASAIASNTDVRGLAEKIFQIEPSVPSSVQKAFGVIRLRSSQFASDIDTPVTLLVKDFWLYAALAVFLGQFLSFWVNNWLTVGRQNKLNQLYVTPIESKLMNLLLKRPDLDGRPEIAEVGALLDSAAQANKLDDVESAKANIKTANDEFDKFASAIPIAQPSTGPPAVVMLQQARSRPGRRLTFVITNSDPAWTGKSVYKWEWSGQRPTIREALTGDTDKGVKQLTKEYLDKQQWRTLYEAPNLNTMSTAFWKSGQYILRVTVDSNQLAPLPFRLEKDASRTFLARIRTIDSAILLLAVVFAAILSYLAIDKLETFGSISDYALAFLGGFGLNATTSGFGAVISRFKAGTS